MAEKILLEAQGLKKAFDGNAILKRVSFKLREGEVVLLRGANGTGKTTLLNILTGNLLPDKGIIHTHVGKSHTFRFPGPWYKQILPFTYFSPERFSKEGLGRTWQDVRLFSSQTLRDNIAVATPAQKGERPLLTLFRPVAVAKQETENLKNAESVLKNFGLKGREESSGDKISLGQSKRVAIARAVQAGSKILFLDEPLAGLDNKGVEQFVDFLRNLVEEQKMTFVIIEHAFNIPKILDLTTSVWTLFGGELIIESKADAIKEQKKKHKDAMLEWLTDFAGKNGRLEMHELPNEARLTVANPNKDVEPVFEAKKLKVNRGQRPVIFHPLSFTLCKGDIAVLEAPNGWGKSTLLDALSGVIPINSGKVLLKALLGEQELNHLPIWERVRCGLSLLRSDKNLFPSTTVRENALLSRLSKKILETKQNRRAGSLSGGEARRLGFECVIESKDAKLLMLDEPFQALDTTEEQRLRDRIVSKTADKTFLIAIPKIYE